VDLLSQGDMLTATGQGEAVKVYPEGHGGGVRGRLPAGTV